MKKIFLSKKIFFLFVLMLLPAISMGRNYSHSQEGFSIKFPDSWEVREKAYGTIVMALSPQESSADNFRENVNIVTENLPGSYTLAQYVSASESSMSRSLNSFKVLSRGVIRIGDRNSQWVIFTHKSGSLVAKGIQYYFVESGKAYIITCTGKPDSFRKYQPAFQKIANTFRIMR